MGKYPGLGGILPSCAFGGGCPCACAFCPLAESAMTAWSFLPLWKSRLAASWRGIEVKMKGISVSNTLNAEEILEILSRQSVCREKARILI